jgi:signal transduction histidine kinase
MDKHSLVSPGSTHQAREDHLRCAEELRELSREVHDQIGHSVLIVLNDLELLELRGEVNGADAHESLYCAKRSALEAHERIRALAARLRVMAGHAQQTWSDPSVDSGKSREKLGGWPDESWNDAADDLSNVYRQLFLVLREAVHNAVTHARARRIAVDVRVSEGWINAVIEDNGDGFEPQRLAPAESVGLASMRERVARVGGHFEIVSCPCRGTSVTIGMPHRRE